ncbi:MAG: hypothetical protein ACI828_001272 [Flavobacteriales bacterium]|jgi:hypothetical protein
MLLCFREKLNNAEYHLTLALRGRRVLTLIRIGIQKQDTDIQ